MKISDEGRAVDQEAKQDGGCWQIPCRKSPTWKQCSSECACLTLRTSSSHGRECVLIGVLSSLLSLSVTQSLAGCGGACSTQLFSALEVRGLVDWTVVCSLGGVKRLSFLLGGLSSLPLSRWSFGCLGPLPATLSLWLATLSCW